MATIEIGGEQFLIDDQDLHIVLSRRWRVQRVADTYVYARACGKHGPLLHRLIAAAPNGMAVDHINGDTRDNRRANLRVCTHQQNLWNRRASRTAASRFKGVSKQTGGCKNWIARIGHSGDRKILGTYPTEELAARAYDKAAVAMYGEFACINFPEHYPDLGCRSAT